MVQEGRVGEVCPHRNRHRSSSVSAGCRSQIRAVRWPSKMGNRGEIERGSRPYYRRGLSTKWAGDHRNWREGESYRVRPSRAKILAGGWRWPAADEWDPLSAGEGYRFGGSSGWAVGWLQSWAEVVPRGPLLFFKAFSFSFFVINLKLLQITSKLIQINFKNL
jgi:hypothetical protein